MKPQQKVFAKIWLGSLSVALGSAPALAQRTPSEWNAPFPAHRIIDNVYFVGTQLLGTFPVTTPEGHILINSDFESTVPVIRDSVESLGFDFEDIDIILGSHAHGQVYNALIDCSFGVNDNYVLVDNPDYPEIADDWAAI